jgi:hypothetical protein
MLCRSRSPSETRSRSQDVRSIHTKFYLYFLSERCVWCLSTLVFKQQQQQQQLVVLRALLRTRRADGKLHLKAFATVVCRKDLGANLAGAKVSTVEATITKKRVIEVTSKQVISLAKEHTKNVSDTTKFSMSNQAKFSLDMSWCKLEGSRVWSEITI